MRVRWTTPAREQLVSAFPFISEDNPKAAARTVGQIWDGAQMLGRHPMLGRPGRVPGTRELVIRDAPFVVAYRIGRKAVEILAVMHAARKWPEEF